MAEGPLNSRQFADMLPFYVNQSLTPDDQARMDEYLSQHESARQQLQFDQLLHQTVQDTVSTRPESQRAQALLLALRQARAQRSGAGLFARWLVWWRSVRWSAPLAIPAPAFAALCLVLLGQGAMIAWDSYESVGHADYRGAGVPCQDHVRLKVLVKPDARVEDLLLALRQARASVRAGPGESGEMLVSLAPGQSLAEGLRFLRAHPAIDAVLPVPVSSAGERCVQP